MKVLVPVDGSERSLRAVEHVIDLHKEARSVHVYLLNVQTPVSVLTRLGVKRADIKRQQQQEGERALRQAQRLLDRAGVLHEDHVAVGPAAETIMKYAARWKCDVIVVGTRGIGATANLVLGSVAMKIVHLAQCPVTLVN
jgi:nucleotide-binding universal stress UspA family protein